jgi:Flp pilus assembly protein TadG
MKITIDVNGKTRSLMPNLQRGAMPSRPHNMREPFGQCMGALLDNGEQGQSLVEFALILPMLLLLATGIMVFGVAMNNYLQLTNAVSVGARTVAINAGVTLDPCATAANAITAAAPGLNPANFTFSYTFSGHPYSNTSCPSSSFNINGSAKDLASGSTATVTATYPFTLSVFGAVFSQNNAVLQATSSELVQ